MRRITSTEADDITLLLSGKVISRLIQICKEKILELTACFQTWSEDRLVSHQIFPSNQFGIDRNTSLPLQIPAFFCERFAT